MSINQFGQVSRLELRFSPDKQGKTVVPHVRFTAPFKVMKPFYDEKNLCSVMMMSSSAGIMEGDRQEFLVELEEGSFATVYSQSYEKIHKMLEGHGERDTNLIQKKNTTLIYSPLPTIPYEGSDFRGNTQIFLEDETSRLAYSEILTCGRVGKGERFLYENYGANLSIYRGNQEKKHLIFSDKVRYQPSSMNMEGFTMQEGFTHQGMLLMVHFSLTADILEEIQEILEEYNQFTDNRQVNGGYSTTYSEETVFRFLGYSGEQILKIQKEITQKVLKSS